MSGLDWLRGMVDGRYPGPPIADLLGFSAAEVEEGRVVFAGTAGLEVYNPIGSVHGGWAATLLDSCMACAVHSKLPPGRAYTTVEIKISYARPIFAESGEMRAEGTLLTFGRRTATAQGKLTDASGKLYAHGTTTCLIFDAP
ncbi:MAG: PaaI family thioesterase [Pseudomonadota bacterium]